VLTNADAIKCEMDPCKQREYVPWKSPLPLTQTGSVISQNTGIQIFQYRKYFRSMPEYTLRCDKKGMLVFMVQHSAGWKNPGRQVARVTKICTVATNICGSSVCILL
jgi:hypothetical protein